MDSQKLKKSIVLLVCICAVLLFGTLPADATIVKIDFTAHVSGFSGLTEFASDVPVVINDTVVGSWFYNTEAPLHAVYGTYDDPNISFDFSIVSSKGGVTFNYDGTNPALTVNTGWSGSNILVVADHDRDGTVGSITATEFASSYISSISDWKPTSGVMYSDSISGSPLPDNLNNLFWHLQYDTFTAPNATTGGGIYISVDTARFSSPDAVPEPATMLLLGLGLMGLSGVRRFKR